MESCKAEVQRQEAGITRMNIYPFQIYELGFVIYEFGFRIAECGMKVVNVEVRCQKLEGGRLRDEDRSKKPDVGSNLGKA